MSNAARFLADCMADCPLVAILRGITPDEVIVVGEALVEKGFTMLEVPLNSPGAIDSISRLSAALEGRALVGAGTVLTVDQVGTVARSGGKLIVSPDSKPDVIRATVSAGLVSLPGYFTVTEAFTAIAAGAHALKLFPAEGAEPALLKAQRAVLPNDVAVLPVGGITPETMAGWLAAGANGFGIGSNLYRPGKATADVVRDAQLFIQARARGV